MEGDTAQLQIRIFKILQLLFLSIFKEVTTDAGPGGSGDRPGGLQLCLFAFVSGLLAFVSG